MTIHSRFLASLPFLVLPLLLCGCASFKPNPEATQSFQQREISKTSGNVTVTMSVLSAKESETVFGVNMSKKKIQPIWLEIDNQTDTPYMLLPILIDQDYYAPLEVAYKYRRRFSKETTRRQDDYFVNMHMPHQIQPNAISSGYVYARREAGIRYAKVMLVKHQADPIELSFAVPVPGVSADFERVDFATLYREDEWIRLEEPDALREALLKLPRATVDKKGKSEGDPLNLVVIANMDSIVPIFSERDWDITEEIRWGSLWKTTKAFFTGSRYQFSPVSSLYVFGRKQDAAFQKIRSSIHERNHLRLWLSPIIYKGQGVWVGQISRDIGVRFSSKTFVTHKIDPDVDSARLYLGQDLLLTHAVNAIGYVGGVEEALKTAPRKNLTGDPYFTDGLRLLTILSPENIDTEELEVLRWDDPPTK